MAGPRNIAMPCIINLNRDFRLIFDVLWDWGGPLISSLLSSFLSSLPSPLWGRSTNSTSPNTVSELEALFSCSKGCGVDAGGDDPLLEGFRARGGSSGSFSSLDVLEKGSPPFVMCGLSEVVVACR